MDDQPIFTNPIPSIGLTTQTERFLLSIKKWAKFFAILGFIGIALMLILAMFAGLLVSNIGSTFPGMLSSGLLTALYLVMALLYFFPVLYLYKFSNSLDKALLNRSSTFMEDAFRHLKSTFQFIGIMTILIIVLYIVILAGIAVVAVSSAM